MAWLRRALLDGRFLLAISLIFASLAGCGTSPTATKDPKGIELLRKAADLIEEQKAFRVVTAVEMRVANKDEKQELKTTYVLSVARPDRLAIRPKDDEDGVVLVTDGTSFSRGASLIRKYVVGESPASLSEVFNDPCANFLGLGIGGAFFGALLSEDAYDKLMQGVAESRDLGVEKIDEQACRHLRFEKSDYNWDAWIETGTQPLLRKVEFAFKSFPGLGVELGPDMKISVVYELHDWELDPKFSDGEFVFTAPEGWEKVDSLQGRMASKEAERPHPLLGKPAPDFELDKLGGGKADLAQHRDKDVVILDFWATWCGPCREALPTIAKVAAKYRDRGVAFYAVDLEESPEDVEKFLSAEKLDLPVIFDSQGTVANLFKVEMIPQTVLIGKDGTVQVVHVGLIDDLEQRLSRELEDLLAGKDLAAEAHEVRDRQQADAEGIELAWSHEGSWTGVAEAMSQSALFALDPAGKVIEWDAEGKEMATRTIGENVTLVRAANLTGDKDSELVTFRVWGSAVSAYAADGAPLWSYEEGEGVDDVWAADLNQDGLDEIIIGYNGGAGLHVLDNAGKLLWKYLDIANVWHVAAGDVGGEAGPEVIATSAVGKVQIFDAKGEHLRDLDPGIYAHLVRTCQNSGDDKKQDLIVVAGQGEPKEELVALNGEGDKQWSLAIGAQVVSAAGCPGRPWVAITVADGSLRVIDAREGREIGHVSGQGKQAAVAWLPQPEGEPLVVVATGQELNAYRLSAVKP